MEIAGRQVLASEPARATHAPVLFVHGFSADARVFEAWLPFFAARGFPAYAVHLRGRGPHANGVDLGRVSVQDFVADAEAVARALGRPAVVGHSQGGLIAQKLAEHDAVAAAALIAPAPPRGISIASRRLLAKQLKYLPAILGSRVITPSDDDVRDLSLNRVPLAEQRRLLDRTVPDSGRAARELSLGVPVDASRVRCPLLVLVGDDDHFIPKRIVERVAARYVAPLQTMVGHGHMIPVEPGWETAADVIARWLSSLSLGHGQP
jgi:non-heme chloroperoxidase